MKNLLAFMFLLTLLSAQAQEKIHSFHANLPNWKGQMRLELIVFDNDSIVLSSCVHAGLGNDYAKLRLDKDTMKVVDYEGWNDFFMDEASYFIIQSEEEWVLYHQDDQYFF